LPQVSGLEEPGPTLYPVTPASAAADITARPAPASLTGSQLQAALMAVQDKECPSPWPGLSRDPAGAATGAPPWPPGIELFTDSGLPTLAVDLALTTQSKLQVTAAQPAAIGQWDAASLLDMAWPRPGVVTEVLYHAGTREDPAATAEAARFAEQGWAVRLTPHLPPVRMVSDQHTVLITLAGTGAVRIREPALSGSLAALFQHAWEAAVPLPARAEPGDPEISPRERALLSYLAAGLTVEAAARRLGISARTAGRLVAGLMAKLGASSRLQAGYEATKRGWL
jgi:DNA-binding CsgD family transcriptional regulator